MGKIVEELSPYENLKNFIDDISYNGKLYNIFGNRYIFRGLSSDKYKLIPSALRDYNHSLITKSGGTNEYIDKLDFIQILGEYNLLYKFFQKSDHNGLRVPNIPKIRNEVTNAYLIPLIEMLTKEKWITDKNLLELAGLAQHYGTPTRLLDWSQDIFVALYFAVSGVLKINKNNEEKGEYMVLWALNSEYIDYKKLYGEEIPLKIIRIPYDGNPNLCAQKGLFTLWQLQKSLKIEGNRGGLTIDDSVKFDNTPLDQLINNDSIFAGNNNDPILYKISIRVSEAKELYKYLQHIGYDASRLFPGYSGVSRCIEEDNLFDSSI